ncbi:hypothetical protein [Paraburkholderia caballeronis]|uniref:hypothetical protein n=1 Tax=Paraburkholderia caballeronis TaxID=416943 RepID=UPI00106532EB|nr:hypothetical protein [Paraburkholderia caballeronis]TDV06026.1 hypothetical protein C7408_1247 [Paraburkholderia caballeronis]TDV09566.1 hypothetical protein C7406_1267 [Paraburkholderia caballeronis]TDV21631.1 hypothetical protein C7404_1217 [Paraburkholderia caballeronis]
MTTSNDLWRDLAAIRHADLPPVDRELLRPAFAALDGGQIIAVPPRVAARIRDLAARQPKQSQ